MNQYPYKFWRFKVEDLFSAPGMQFEESTSIEIRSMSKEDLFVKLSKFIKVDPFKDTNWKFELELCEMQIGKLEVLSRSKWDHATQQFILTEENGVEVTNV